MMRVSRQHLNGAIEALLVAAHSCTDTGGRRLVFHPSAEQAEAVILGALTTLAHPTGPVSPDDVFFLDMVANTSWPPHLKANDQHTGGQ